MGPFPRIVVFIVARLRGYFSLDRHSRQTKVPVIHAIEDKDHKASKKAENKSKKK